MRRFWAIAGFCLLALAGCDRPSGNVARQMAEIRAPLGRDGENHRFSYTNFWWLTMSREFIAPRFERARAACLSDKTLDCKLVSSNIDTSTDSAYSYATASLEILLPHGQVEGFRKALLAPIGKEPPTDIVIRSNTTHSENVDEESLGAGRKVLQLTGYHDRLVSLSKRPNLTIEDTIRLEAEISRVQGELDDAIRGKADVDGRVARETVNINLAERAQGEIAGVWDRASDSFVQSVAAALDFLIRVIPWLPILAAAVLLITWLVKLLWRRKQ